MYVRFRYNSGRVILGVAFAFVLIATALYLTSPSPSSAVSTARDLLLFSGVTLLGLRTLTYLLSRKHPSVRLFLNLGFVVFGGVLSFLGLAGYVLSSNPAALTFLFFGLVFVNFSPTQRGPVSPTLRQSEVAFTGPHGKLIFNVKDDRGAKAAGRLLGLVGLVLLVAFVLSGFTRLWLFLALPYLALSPLLYLNPDMGPYVKRYKFYEGILRITGKMPSHLREVDYSSITKVTIRKKRYPWSGTRLVLHLSEKGHYIEVPGNPKEKTLGLDLLAWLRLKIAEKPPSAPNLSKTEDAQTAEAKGTIRPG